MPLTTDSCALVSVHRQSSHTDQVALDMGQNGITCLLCSILYLFVENEKDRDAWHTKAALM